MVSLAVFLVIGEAVDMGYRYEFLEIGNSKMLVHRALFDLFTERPNIFHRSIEGALRKLSGGAVIIGILRIMAYGRDTFPDVIDEQGAARLGGIVVMRCVVIGHGCKIVKEVP